MFAWAFVQWPSFTPRWSLLLIPLAPIVGLSIGLPIERRHRRRVALVQRTRFRACLRCEQELTGLPDEGMCPECGTPYKLDELRRGWIRKIGSDPTDGKGGTASEHDAPPHI